ncbi:MAG: ABC transporter substrate-binding protein [Kineosporiaceae bacterium]
MRRASIVGAAALAVVMGSAACGGDEADTVDDTATAADTADGTAAPDTAEAADASVPPTTVTVGVIPIVDVAPLYLGVEQGFFAARGLELELVPAQGGAAIVPGVVSEEYQFGFSNNTSLLLATDSGIELQMVAAGSSSTGVEGEDFGAVVASADSGITDAADLAGRRVAVNTLNNIGDTTVRDAVAQAGGDDSTIEFVELAFPDMPAALENGDVDAAFVVEPFLTITTSAGATPVAWMYATAAEDLSVATYFTSDAYAAENPDVVAAFQAAMIESQEYATDNPDALREILTTYTEIDAALIPEITLPAFPSEINDASIEELNRLATEQGVLPQEVDLGVLLP